MSNEIDIYDLFELAMHGTLPKGFKDWAEADKNGWSVAHVAAYNGHLPPDFDQWGICDKDGWTVAHSAAYNSKLPKNFHIGYPDVWTLKDIHDISVEEVALENRYIVQ